MKRRYGCRVDKYDPRDFRYDAVRAPRTFLPPSADLRPLMSPVEDQGQTNTCVANAIVGALEYLEKKNKISFVDYSRLFLYYNGEVMQGTPGQDAGLAIRTGIQSVVKYGTCYEQEWPFDPLTIGTKPSKQCYTDAAVHKVLSYARVNTMIDMKSCIANGYPFVIGMQVYESMESDEVAKTGVVEMPKVGEQLLGGHGVLVVGYSDATSTWTVRNSWGVSWGMSGYFTLPYAYLTNHKLVSDMWDIQKEA